LKRAKEETGLPIITEVMDAEHIELIGSYVDIYQVGARNMQNYTLLDKLGMQSKPVLLKRGIAADIDELLGVCR